jgi:hypothetical protein
MSTNEADLKVPPATDFVAAAFFLVWAAVGWIAFATNQPLVDSLGAGADPGPALMPLIALATLTAGGTGIAIKAALRLRRTGDTGSVARWKDHATPAAYALSVIVAVVAMPRIGFMPAAVVLSAIWLIALSPRRKSSLWALALEAVLAVLIPLGVFLLFARLLLVPLP